MEKFKERVDKIIASTGLMSRKDAKRAAAERRIRLNGAVIKDTSAKATEEDELTLDGRKILYKRYTYIMMNKPKGYVCSTDDPSSPIVNELLDEALQRLPLFSIGRLDKDTTGLIILTNNGPLAHSLLSPSKHVEKSYEFELEDPFEDGYFELFESGVVLDDGYVCLPAKLTRLGERRGAITVCEGKYHQIKRMFESAGNRICTLKRISIGGVKLDEALNCAEYRPLTDEEAAALKGHF